MRNGAWTGTSAHPLPIPVASHDSTNPARIPLPRSPFPVKTGISGGPGGSTTTSPTLLVPETERKAEPQVTHTSPRTGRQSTLISLETTCIPRTDQSRAVPGSPPCRCAQKPPVSAGQPTVPPCLAGVASATVDDPVLSGACGPPLPMTRGRPRTTLPGIATFRFPIR